MGSRTTLSRTLGLILTDLSNPFFGNVAAAAEEAARKANFGVLVCDSGEDFRRERAQIEKLRELGVDGLALAAAGPDFEHLLELKDEGYPFVLLDRRVEELDCDWVAVENVAASRRLCEELVRHGAARIAFASGPISAATARERLEGYRAALRGRHIPFETALVHRGDFGEQCGREAAERFLQLPKAPDAIYCANNRIFAGCLDRLSPAPKVPWAHLPIACFDEPPFLAHLGRPVVFAAQPERALGRRTAELLIERVLSGPPGSFRMRKPFIHEMLDVEQKSSGF